VDFRSRFVAGNEHGKSGKRRERAKTREGEEGRDLRLEKIKGPRTGLRSLP